MKEEKKKLPDREKVVKGLEQCYKALSVYTHTEEHLPSARYGEMAESVIKTFEPERKCLSPRKVIILVAAIITILALTGCSIIGLVLFDVISLGKTLLNFDENTSVVQGEMEIVRAEDIILYDTIEDMIAEQSFPNVFPSTLPASYELKLAEVIVVNDKRQVNIKYEDSEDGFIRITVIEDYSQNWSGENKAFDNQDVYVNRMEGDYQASWEYDNDSYSIQCSDKDLLYEIITYLKEY